MSIARALSVTAVTLLMVGHLSQTKAEPLLQIYAEGATYDTESESWILAPSGSSSGDAYKLWVIGNVDGPGGKGTIEDVRMSVAYDIQYFDADGDGNRDENSLSITLTPSTITYDPGNVGPYDDFFVPGQSIPGSLDLTFDNRHSEVWDPDGDVGVGIYTTNGLWEDGPIVTDRSAPVLSSGKALPWHGTFGEGTVWAEFGLGDFENAEWPVGDFLGQLPTELHDTAAQINVYEVSVQKGSGAVLHFDVYNHLESKNRAVFGPFSHDVTIVPAPSASVALAGMAAMGLVARLWRRPKRPVKGHKRLRG